MCFFCVPHSRRVRQLTPLPSLLSLFSSLPFLCTIGAVKGFVMRKGDLTDVLRSSDSDDGSTSRGDNDDAGPSDT